ncbi:MAG: hypothetical protein HON65_15545 [Rhodospirillales bacterium]|nr:hypothetical protein [Rhodospirillales bacterium]
MKFYGNKTIGYCRILAVIPFVALMALTACDTPRSSDYESNHEFVIGEETISMEISGALDQEIPGPVFNSIVHEFQGRANGPIAIEIKRFGQSDEQVASNISMIKQILMKSGVRASQIIVMPMDAGNDLNAVLSFTANTVQLPECGDWSSSSSSNWSNTVHSNLGCATQRNLGLMVANPGDLQSAQTMSDFPGDMGAVIIRTYRATAGGTE